jgi:hypothetical protein
MSALLCRCGCGATIPPERIAHARKTGVEPRYASAACRRRAQNARAQKRIADRKRANGLTEALTAELGKVRA